MVYMSHVVEKETFSFDEWVEGIRRAFAHIDGEWMQSDRVTDKAKTAEDAALKKRMADRVAMLGIPEDQMTPEVSLAVSALMEKLDDVNRELSRTKENLSEIERLVDVDPIAPIPNRRAFMRRLTWAITMHQRYGHPSTILFFDLNDFKQVNDQYGHAAGDMAIRHVSQLLTNTMRESDFLARIGGDEFSVIMYYAEEEAAKKRGQKIAEKLKKTPLMFGGKRLELSAAVGYYTLQNGDDAESALASADTSMYMDKRRSKSGGLVD